MMRGDDYSPVTGDSGDDNNIASFDLEISSNRQRHESATPGRRIHLVTWFLLASIAVASYCIYAGILDLPKGLIGAPIDEDVIPSNDDFSGLKDDDWENDLSVPPLGYDEEEDNITQEQEKEQQQQMSQDESQETEEDNTTQEQQQISQDESQEAEEATTVLEPQHNEQKHVVDDIKFVFCYGDSLTSGFVPAQTEPHPYAPALETELNSLYDAASATIAPELQHPPNIVVQSVGFPGMLASTMLQLVEEEIGACSIVKNSPKLSVMVVLTGTNDLMHLEFHDSEAIDTDEKAQMILQSITGLLKAILECAQKTGNEDMHILSVGIPGSRLIETTPVASEIALRVNNGLKEFSSSYYTKVTHDKVVYRDFPFEYDETDSKWGADGLHLTALGYDEMGNQLANAVKSILDKMYVDR